MPQPRIVFHLTFLARMMAQLLAHVAPALAVLRVPLAWEL